MDKTLFFTPAHLNEDINCHDFLAEAGQFITEVMKIKSTSFLVFDKTFGFSCSSPSFFETESLSESRSALEYSKIFCFDVIVSSEKNPDGNYLVKSYLNGDLLKSIIIDKDIIDLVDEAEFIKKIQAPFQESIQKRRKEFSQKWISFRTSNKNFDFERIFSENNNDEIMRLLSLTNAKIDRNWKKLLKMGLPLGYIGYFYQDLTNKVDVLKSIIEESAKLPSTFYLPGDESKYNPQFVFMYQSYKNRVRMEAEVFSEKKVLNKQPRKAL